MPRTTSTRSRRTAGRAAGPLAAGLTGGLAAVLAAGLLVAAPAGATEEPAASSSSTAPAPEPTPDTAGPGPASPAPSRLAIHVPARVEWGQTATVTVRLTTDDGTPVEGAPVMVYAKPHGRETFSGLARVVTAADGLATTPYRPGAGTVLTARYAGSETVTAAASPDRGVAVLPRLVSQVTPSSVARYATAHVTGAVGPARPGGVVALQRFDGGAWRYLSSARLDGSSRYAFPQTPRHAGSWLLRVFVPPAPGLLPAVGPGLRLSAGERVLSRGMSGADVRAVQLRLAALRYDVGAANGTYGYDTAHAVQAFQKVQGLPRTSKVDARTRSALARPVQPRLRQSRSGVWVEADLTKQVLYIGRSGRLDRVLDISSGSGELYTVEGQTSRAVTPLGQFRVNRKINGMRVSRLGELYKPSYFNNSGYAIHGSPSVPAYPASHGCIRITNPAADRWFSTFAIGVPVAIYRS